MVYKTVFNSQPYQTRAKQQLSGPMSIDVAAEVNTHTKLVNSQSASKAFPVVKRNHKRLLIKGNNEEQYPSLEKRNDHLVAYCWTRYVKQMGTQRFTRGM